VTRATGWSRQAWLVAIATLSFGAVAVALVTQHMFDMQPCPWCVLQRLVFVAVGVLALAGLGWRSALGQRVLPLLLLLLCSGGIAAALWQHFVAAASASCNLTLADRIVSGLQLDALLPSVFQATATCADAAVNLLGLPYEFWSVTVFIAIEAAALVLLVRVRAPAVNAALR
jgi:disulfide bond formation protein DsbB